MAPKKNGPLRHAGFQLGVSGFLRSMKSSDTANNQLMHELYRVPVITFADRLELKLLYLNIVWTHDV